MPPIIDIYQLKDDESTVTVEFIFGHAASAETVVRMDGVPQGGTLRDSFTLQPGTNRQLNGRRLEARSYAAKVAGSNLASLTVKVTGGAQPMEFKAREDSAANPAIFTVQIDFFI
jgi:hypothetical protein